MIEKLTSFITEHYILFFFILYISIGVISSIVSLFIIEEFEEEGIKVDNNEKFIALILIIGAYPVIIIFFIVESVPKIIRALIFR